MFTAYIIKKRYMLIIDGHDVYEIDEECESGDILYRNIF